MRNDTGEVITSENMFLGKKQSLVLHLYKRSVSRATLSIISLSPTQKATTTTIRRVLLVA
jgi:hypothetical protein